MQALNKKFPSYEDNLDNLVSNLENFSLLAVSILSLHIAIIDLVLGLESYQAVLIYPSIFLLALHILKSYFSVFTAFTVFLGFYYSGFDLFMVLLIIVFLEIGFKVLTNFFSEKTALLVLANVSHIGDAITTYLGLNKGFEEQNPFVLSVIAYFGYEAIFLVKSIVVPLTLIPYYLDFSNSKLFFKIVFAIGLYLTIRNFLVIQF